MTTALIVGPGRLGGYAAHRLLASGLMRRVLVAGRSPARAAGVIQDLRESSRRGELADASEGSIAGPIDLCVFAFSDLRWSPDIGVNDRWLEAERNLATVDELRARLSPSDIGQILVLSNPVDIITQHTAARFAGCRVAGLGVSLDEVRMAQALERKLGVSVDRVPCVGEHGRDIVPLLSQVAGLPPLAPQVYEDLRGDAFRHTGTIVKNVGIPLYGPMAEIDRLLLALGNREACTLSLSRPLSGGPFGVSGVSLGVPTSIEGGIIGEVLDFDASDFERELFLAAAASVRASAEKFARSRGGPAVAPDELLSPLRG